MSECHFQLEHVERWGPNLLYRFDGALFGSLGDEV